MLPTGVQVQVGVLMKTVWIFMLLMICGKIVCCSGSGSEIELEPELEIEIELTEGSVDFCMFEFPYTFSKCLSICHSNLNPSCLGDSLCVCQSAAGNENLSQNLTMKETLDEETSCKKKNYCDVSCKEIKIPSNLNSRNRNSQQFFSEGQLCSKGSRSACVCFIH